MKIPGTVFPCHNCGNNDPFSFFIRECKDDGIRLECAHCGGTCPNLYGAGAEIVKQNWIQARKALIVMNDIISKAREAKERKQ